MKVVGVRENIPVQHSIPNIESQRHFSFTDVLESAVTVVFDDEFFLIITEPLIVDHVYAGGQLQRQENVDTYLMKEGS